eukprot:TRINITY_DN2708_c0_g1_i1.p1 TRINITY_DN2708_c0_g1~~TRINITY_DN2708_c0_g1_i1.p1  ORF type:complete len:552 (+),score=40.95 TRINITY_DN2708_c0_g1_i1:37-1656(+)
MEIPDCTSAYTGLQPVFALEVLGKSFVYGSVGGLLQGVTLQSGAPSVEYKGHNKTVRAIVAAEDELSIYSASSDGQVRSWDPRNGESLWVGTNHAGGVLSLALCADLLVSGGEDGCINLWGSNNGEHKARIKAHTGAITGIARSDGLLFTSSSDGLCKAIDIEQGTLVAVFECMAPTKCLVSFKAEQEPLPGLCTIVCGCTDRKLRMYDVRTAHCVKSFEGHREVIFSACVHGDVLYSGSDDGTIIHWDIATAKAEHTFQGHGDGVSCLRIGPSSALISGSFDKSVRAWDRDSVLERIRIRRLLNELPPVKTGAAAGDKSKRELSRRSIRPQSAPRTPTKSPKSPKSRPVSAQRRSQVPAGKQKHGAGEAVQRELAEFEQGNLSLVHSAFMRHCTETGLISAAEFRKCLESLGVTQPAIVERSFVTLQSDGTVNHRLLVRELNRLANGPEKMRVLRACFLAFDTKNTGSVTKQEVEIALHAAARAGSSEVTAKGMLELFHPLDEPKATRSFSQFCAAMAINPRLVSAFLPVILAHVSQQ